MSEVQLQLTIEESSYAFYSRLHKIKILVIGDHGTGKTWLLSQFCQNNSFDSKIDYGTKGCDVHIYKPATTEPNFTIQPGIQISDWLLRFTFNNIGRQAVCDFVSTDKTIALGRTSNNGGIQSSVLGDCLPGFQFCLLVIQGKVRVQRKSILDDKRSEGTFIEELAGTEISTPLSGSEYAVAKSRWKGMEKYVLNGSEWGDCLQRRGWVRSAWEAVSAWFKLLLLFQRRTPQNNKKIKIGLV